MLSSKNLYFADYPIDIQCELFGIRWPIPAYQR